MAAKRKQYARKEVLYQDTDQGKVAIGARFKFSNGTVRDYMAIDYPETIRIELISHGMKDKIGDNFNTVSTVVEAIDKADTMHERLKRGEFHIKATRGPRIIPLVWIHKAIAEQRNMDMERVVDIWDNVLTTKQRDNILTGPGGAATRADALKLQAVAKAENTPLPDDDPLAAFGETGTTLETLADDIMEELTRPDE